MTNSNNTQLFEASVQQSIQPLLENISTFKRFKGCYTMVGCIEKTDKQGKQYWIMHLSDISTFINVYCFNMNDFIAQLQPNSIVHIEATLKYDNVYVGNYHFPKHVEHLSPVLKYSTTR